MSRHLVFACRALLFALLFALGAAASAQNLPEVDVVVTPIVSAGEVPGVTFFSTDLGNSITFTLELRERSSSRIRSVTVRLSGITIGAPGQQAIVYPAIVAFAPDSLSAQILEITRNTWIDSFIEEDIPFTNSLIDQFVNATVIVDKLDPGTWDVSLRTIRIQCRLIIFMTRDALLRCCRRKY